MSPAQNNLVHYPYEFYIKKQITHTCERERKRKRERERERERERCLFFRMDVSK
jgi:hypothetical protein